jgi:hypothetical protein
MEVARKKHKEFREDPEWRWECIVENVGILD